MGDSYSIALAPADIGNLFLAIAALTGLVILHRVITAHDPSAPLNRRFLLGLRVMMVLFAGRALLVITGLEGVRFFILLAATLIPLCVLLLVEGLLRRHAPAWAKLWIAAGTFVFALASLWWSGSIDPARLWGLLAFQLSGFFIAGWLILTRDRASLSSAENRMVDRLALSLFVLIPLAAADFIVALLGLPMQTSPLGVLFLCWLAVSLGRAQTQHRAPLVWFFALVAGALVTGVAVALIGGLDKDATILTGAVILAAVMVAVLAVEAQGLRADAQSQTLLHHLAQDRSTDALGFLRALQAHPLVEGAGVIDAAQLGDFDGAVLQRIFHTTPVLRRADPSFTQGAEGDHIAHLFRLFDASHILLVDDAPLTLVGLSMPALTTAPRSELELQAVQRMAWLLSKETR